MATKFEVVNAAGGLDIVSKVLPPNMRSIAAALPIGGKRTVYKIDGEAALRLHVLPTRKNRASEGEATYKANWYAHYRLRSGDRAARQDRLGSRDTMSLAEARAMCRELLSKAHDKKIDPRKEEQARREAVAAENYTFRDLFDVWLEKYAKPNLRSSDQPEARIKKHALPVIGHMVLADIRPKHISLILDSLMAEGKGTQANRVRAHVHAVFKWGLSREIGLEYNPVAMTLRPKRREQPRNVTYSEDDMKRLWRAIDEGALPMEVACGLVLKIALVTGQRKAEIVGAMISELELEGDFAEWRLDSSRTKSGRDHVVPLSPLAVALFREAIKKLGRANRTYVFPSETGKNKLPHLAGRSVSQALARSRGTIGLTNGQTVHDLRRTANTQMTRLGFPSEIRARVLNHAKKGVTDGVYNAWEYDTEKREALEKWAKKLEEMVGYGD